MDSGAQKKGVIRTIPTSKDGVGAGVYDDTLHRAHHCRKCHTADQGQRLCQQAKPLTLAHAEEQNS